MTSFLQFGVMALMALIGWLNGSAWGYYRSVLVAGAVCLPSKTDCEP
ncbi:hypothetical protein KCP73_10340 [Salmonella enterica subsp. enterica]|nr:hypothetical protein KCP73_10340 [Salmonella enterica subsp. enterica]